MSKTQTLSKSGILTELEVQHFMAKLGVIISIPYGDCARYDQIWDIDGKLTHKVPAKGIKEIGRAHV